MLVICTCFFFWFEEKLKAASAAAASTLSWRHGRDSGILQRALQVCQKFAFLLISTTEIYNEDCPGIGYTCMALVKHALSLYLKQFSPENSEMKANSHPWAYKIINIRYNHNSCEECRTIRLWYIEVTTHPWLKKVDMTSSSLSPQ